MRCISVEVPDGNAASSLQLFAERVRQEEEAKAQGLVVPSGRRDTVRVPSTRRRGHPIIAADSPLNQPAARRPAASAAVDPKKDWWDASHFSAGAVAAASEWRLAAETATTGDMAAPSAQGPPSPMAGAIEVPVYTLEELARVL